MSERCEDLISRKKAIYAVADYIHNIDRVFSTGLLSDDDCKDAAASVLEDLPSAQLKIVRCKDCKHWEQESICDGYCSEIEKGGFDEDHFCSFAERREE